MRKRKKEIKRLEREWRQANKSELETFHSNVSQQLMEIPGFYLDPNTKKYYKLSKNSKNLSKPLKFSTNSTNVECTLNSYLLTRQLTSVKFSYNPQRLLYRNLKQKTCIHNNSKIHSFDFDWSGNSAIIGSGNNLQVCHLDGYPLLISEGNSEISSTLFRQYGEKKYASCTFMGFADRAAEYLIYDIEYMKPIIRHKIAKNLPLWTHAASKYLPRYILGSQGVFFDIELHSFGAITIPRYLKNRKMDILSQAFSSDDKFFGNGVRDGQILVADTRFKETIPIKVADSAINGLFWFDLHLTAVTRHEISKWDIRYTKRPLMVNEINFSGDSFSCDVHPSGLTAAVCDDGYLHCWDQYGAQLIRTSVAQEFQTVKCIKLGIDEEIRSVIISDGDDLKLYNFSQ